MTERLLSTRIGDVFSVSEPSYAELHTSVFTEEMRKRNRIFYNSVASDYANDRAWTLKNENSIRGHILNRIKPYLRKESQILVIGAGTGKDQDILQKSGYSCYGLDLSFPMVNEAKKRIEDHLTVSEARFIPYAEQSFDFVYCDAAAEHMDQGYLFYALNEFRRVIKNEGYAFLSVRKGNGRIVEVFDTVGNQTLPKYFSTYSQRSVIDLIEQSGFEFGESWITEGGTPVTERPYPWLNCIIRSRSEMTSGLGRME